MKTISLVVLLLGLSVNAFAQDTQKIQCVSETDQYKRFSATLDYSDYQPGSGYFKITSAELMDNYMTANLICDIEGGLGEFGCVGYAFNVGDSKYVVQLDATFDRANKKINVSYTGPVIGNSPMTATWSCDYNPGSN